MDTIKQNIYYLNIGELSTFCDRHNIPYIIYKEVEPNILKKTQAIDRKEIVIKKILKFIAGKKVNKTIIRLDVISNEVLPLKLKKQ